MFIILDVIVVAVVALLAWLSARRGFVRSLIELVGFIGLFVLILTGIRPLCAKIYDSSVERTVVERVEDIVDRIGGEDIERIKNGLPDEIKRAAAALGVDLDEIFEDGISADRVAEHISRQVVRPMAVDALYSLLSVLVFVIGMVVVRFAAKGLNRLFKAPVLGALNKGLGAVFGAAKGVILMTVISAAVSLAVRAAGRGFWIFTEANIDKSFLFGNLAKVLHG